MGDRIPRAVAQLNHIRTMRDDGKVTFDSWLRKTAHCYRLLGGDAQNYKMDDSFALAVHAENIMDFVVINT